MIDMFVTLYLLCNVYTVYMDCIFYVVLLYENVNKSVL